ncbi:MAG: prolyl oligopeptidase family serine peptidase [Panacagrimonas sp.]
MLRLYAFVLAAVWMVLPFGVAAMVEERLPITLESGRTLEAVMRRPQSIVEPLPAVVLIGGFRRGVGALDLLPPSEKLIFVGLDYPADVPKRIRWWQIPGLSGEMERGLTDTREALGLLHRELRIRTDVDADRITLAGASLGSLFAVIAAAEHDYPRLVVAHGFGDVPGMIRYQFEKKLEPKYGAVGRWVAWLAQHGISLLIDIPAPEIFAERLQAHQRVLLIKAQNDDFIPADATAALLDALRRSEAQIELRTTPGKHVRGARNPEAVKAIYNLFEEWLLREE